MKAIIMAGGRGLRLRPVNEFVTKTMVRLFDRPIMEYIIELLKASGIVRIAVAAGKSRDIEQYFGNGERFGVSISYYYEESPLSTAGSVAACRDFIGDDDFFVISGDVLCDFDLRAAAKVHIDRAADLTMLLARSESPCDFGVVLTDASGRVTQFTEKPQYSGSSVINSGVYILSPDVLLRIPSERPFDFARDLLPALLADGAAVIGYETGGAWFDVGTPARLMECMEAALDGRLSILPTAGGVNLNSAIPASSAALPPVYVGRGVTIGRECRLGPYCSIGEKSEIGDGVSISHAIVEQSKIGTGSDIKGSIICKGSSIRPHARVGNGAVVGAGSYIGENAAVLDGVMLCAGSVVPDGAVADRSILEHFPTHSIVFNEFGAISGGVADITPELAMALGSAVASSEMRIAVGYSSSGICKLLANSFIAGAGATGSQVTETDASFAAVAAYIARSYLFNLTVFIENDDGKLRIRIMDRSGLPIDRELQRNIERAIAQSESPRAGISDIVMPKNITGAKEAFASSYAQRCGADGFLVAVDGKSPASDLLRYVLSMAGCTVTEPKSGVLTLSAGSDGMQLGVCDEEGVWYDDGHVTALLALVYFLAGGNELAVSSSAPSVLEQIADEYGGRILRIGRDGGARETFMAQGVMCDAAASAIFLCEYLSRTHTSVRKIAKQLPDFTLISREISVGRDRREVINALANSGDGLHKENLGCLRVCADGGWVSISPSRSKSALRITGEGMSEEIASELCNLFVERARSIDSSGLM